MKSRSRMRSPRQRISRSRLVKGWMFWILRIPSERKTLNETFPLCNQEPISYCGVKELSKALKLEGPSQINNLPNKSSGHDSTNRYTVSIYILLERFTRLPTQYFSALAYFNQIQSEWTQLHNNATRAQLGSVKRLESIWLFWPYINKIELHWTTQKIDTVVY